MSTEAQTRLISTTSAAHYLGVGSTFVRMLVYKGQLQPTIRLRRLWRFDVRDLDAWIERQKIASL